ncbi:MAG TPA: hypothetical protein VIF62_12895 [Labilithrix sp.]
MKKCVLLLLLALPLTISTRARADSCDDRCHVDETGGGGGCTSKTEEERQQEQECYESCESHS